MPIVISNATMPKKTVKAAYENPVAQGLYQTIANLYAITAATQFYHFNLVGREFFSIHPALGGQYEASFELTDQVGERLRALNLGVAPLNLTTLHELAGMPEMSVDPKDCVAAVNSLIAMHNKSLGDLKALVKVSGEMGDLVTQNMVLTWVENEEKTVWMLKSFVS